MFTTKTDERRLTNFSGVVTTALKLPDWLRNTLVAIAFIVIVALLILGWWLANTSKFHLSWLLGFWTGVVAILMLVLIFVGVHIAHQFNGQTWSRWVGWSIAGGGAILAVIILGVIWLNVPLNTKLVESQTVWGVLDAVILAVTYLIIQLLAWGSSQHKIK